MSNSLERRHNRRRRHERTRQELIEAALSQAVAGSFKELTVESITREAGVSRSAFYVYFGDKEELLLGALEDLIASQQDRLGTCWPAGGDARRGIEKSLYDVSRTFADNSDLLGLAYETATYDEEVREIWSALMEKVIEGTAAEIRTRQSEGAINASYDADALAEGLVLMTERGFQLHLAESESGAEEVAAWLTKVWWATLFGATTTTAAPRPETAGPDAAGSELAAES